MTYRCVAIPQHFFRLSIQQKRHVSPVDMCRSAEISDHFLTCSGDSLVTCLGHVWQLPKKGMKAGIKKLSRWSRFSPQSQAFKSKTVVLMQIVHPFFSTWHIEKWPFQSRQPQAAYSDHSTNYCNHIYILYLSIYLSIYLPTCLPACLPAYLPTYLNLT